MTITKLYDLAAQNKIDIFPFELNGCESLSLLDNGDCFVAINPYKIENNADEKVKLAHELGHCTMGAFYNIFSPIDIRSKHERTANKWAIKKLIPEDELKEACVFCNNRYELSEYFGVTEEFMQKALDYYSAGNLS